jgi:4-amino-4-deoxy-L-arabinose transferase-like glycosyltransferase
MKAAPVASASIPLATPARGMSLGYRVVFLVGAGAALGMLLLNVFCREFYSGDEGFYGVTALNMLQSPAYLIRPSYSPAGDFTIEKEAFAHPPLNSYLYAVTLWLGQGSLVGPELLNVLSFGLLLFFTWRVVQRFDNEAAAFTILLLAVSPAVLTLYSQLEAEPLMTTFGMMALYFTLRAEDSSGQKHWLILAGLCLGFAFALKLWLVGPLVLAVGTALLLSLRQSLATAGSKLTGLALFALAALIPASLHRRAVALTYPADLSFWLKNIYFGVFTGGGISGSKLTGAGMSGTWAHPFWYYGPALYRDHFFLAPILLLGMAAPYVRPARRDGWFGLPSFPCSD